MNYRVFVERNGFFGNHVEIVTDVSQKLKSEDKVAICKESGLSEVVFIISIDPIKIEIFNPQQQVNFAGHALLGLGAFLHEKTTKSTFQVPLLHGNATITKDQDIFWVSSEKSFLPNWNLLQLRTLAEVEGISPLVVNKLEHTVIWAWLDRNQHRVRARTFAPDWGILEDEANGSGSMLLADRLKTTITVIHGKGSEIFARYESAGKLSVGGRVVNST